MFETDRQLVEAINDLRSRVAILESLEDQSAASLFPDISVHVYRTTNYTIAHNTLVPIPFTSERYDTDTMHDNATNPTRLTCKTAGKFLVMGFAEWYPVSTGRRALYIRLNGSTLITGSEAAPAQPTKYNLVIEYQLTVNDYVELIAYQDSGGGTQDIDTSSMLPWFAMRKVA